MCNRITCNQIFTPLICYHAANCDYECLKSEMTCPRLEPTQVQIMDAICHSGLVYFIVPKYCGYPCVGYFACNERGVGYFNMDWEKMEHSTNVLKRFILVSNTENIDDTMRKQTNNEPQILYLKSQQHYWRYFGLRCR